MCAFGPTRFRFGDFEADLHAGELFRNGARIPVQEKPLRVLGVLLHRRGELVARKQIFEDVWGDTYVQEDQSLNTAIRKLRLALADSSETPKYIETVGSRGYRFIYPVEVLDDPRPATRQGVRLAVLPFTNLGPDPEEHFADGITEEMIARLGRLYPRFSVIAPDSVMRYKRACKEISEILRELSVDYVLSCAVRRSGERVRITTRLINGEDQSCVWSDSYDRAVTDVFEIQNEIAEKIARCTTRLLSASSMSTTSSAHELYLRGRYFWNKRTRCGMLKSIDFFQQAIQEDPDYSAAYVGLADAYVMLAQHGMMRSTDALPKAKAAAENALRLEPSRVEARVSLAWVKMIYERDYMGAETECRTVLQANPSYALAYIPYAFMLTLLGRYSEAIMALRCALHLDPVSLPINALYASLLFWMRRFDASIRQCTECFELDPQFMLVHAIYGQALEAKGMLAEATERFKVDVELAPWSLIARAHLARVHAVQGMREECNQNLEIVMKARQDRYVPAYYIALIHAALGDADAVFEWLDRAEQERSNWVLFASADYRLDRYHDDPRFAALLERLHLPEMRPVNSAEAITMETTALTQ